MARRKAPALADGVTGLFDRTVEAWQALGAPKSLYDDQAGAEAYRRCSGWDLSALESTFSHKYLQRLCAHRWQQVARPQFLSRVGNLTAAERTELERVPALLRLRSNYSAAAVNQELANGPA